MLHVWMPAKIGDPDMDTMPVLAWSLEMARAAHSSTSARFMIAHQVNAKTSLAGGYSILRSAFIPFQIQKTLIPMSGMCRGAPLTRIKVYQSIPGRRSADNVDIVVVVVIVIVIILLLFVIAL